MTSLKQRRTQQIQQAVTIIANHYNVDPTRIITKSRKRLSNATVEARYVLAYHLHKSGFSHERIAKFFDRSPDCAERWTRAGLIRIMSEDRTMIESLPTIDNSLDITKAP